MAEQEALLGWLNDAEDAAGNEGTKDDAAALRRRLTGVLAGLPAAIKRHLDALLALEQRIVEPTSARSPRSTGSASTSGWNWRSRCAGSRTRCTAG